MRYLLATVVAMSVWSNCNNMKFKETKCSMVKCTLMQLWLLHQGMQLREKHISASIIEVNWKILITLEVLKSVVLKFNLVKCAQLLCEGVVDRFATKDSKSCFIQATRRSDSCIFFSLFASDNLSRVLLDTPKKQHASFALNKIFSIAII